MRTQEQAFRAYYSAMTDSELLEIAAHESSFIPIAQRVLEHELAKRHLTPAPPASSPRRSLFRAWKEHTAKWTGRLHHRAASP
ncbi:MAG TPA: hypothetical protein VKT49_07380 [Bryobacteraceae bacterium]|nr:hypothetical protein [Bryobacteraceae bacterium]